ncbi:sodium:solute symporter family transporter [Aeoliella sp.]|uniref:sodium:solute symporter family transporter n=1 Tax=Aeoliella sp. TaxID=2795800 RepID=UPI003CCC3C26
MTIIDWLVIAAYLMGMIGIGIYFAMQNRSREDYLLGGRSMKATAVGLSLFASLFSANSYLAFPADTALYGPIAGSMILSYPIVFVIVGYGLIPQFMRLRITSAYEILELRFGTGLRMLGALMFLLLRLLWMGTIIYATADKVLVPLLNLDKSATPYFCVGITVLTIVYTAMGGLRAVVISDAIQSVLLLAGALLTVVVAMVAIGGPEEMLQAEATEHWARFDWTFDISVRATVPIVLVSQLVWWVCTCGSDQMAVQRYLATRDARTARKMLGISLVSSAATIATLVLVGMALGAYYREFPSELAPHTLASTDWTNVAFPKFITHGLPTGITGAIIAGLLAAAMSSLSSGFNSSSLVIAVDFLDRIGNKTTSAMQSPLRAQALTVIVGILTILVSLAVAKLGKGHNLFDLVINNSNVLVTPLFLLFFMAMFVPWATRLGVWCGVLAATYLAVSLGFFNNFGFGGLWQQSHPMTFWMMPVSLLVGAAVGCLVSLLPWSQRCPSLELAAPEELDGSE